MDRKKVLILGAGGHAHVIAGILLQSPTHEVVGFLDDNDSKNDMLGIKKLGKLTPVNHDLPTKNVVMGIGQVGNRTLYKKIITMYEEVGFTFETVIAPSAKVSPFATIGKGVIVADGAIIQPLANIGDYTIINTNSSVDHECTIGNYCHVAPGCTLSGNITIGNECFLGTGTSVIHGISITDNCILGAGSVVIASCNESGTYVGVPAKKIK